MRIKDLKRQSAIYGMLLITDNIIQITKATQAYKFSATITTSITVNCRDTASQGKLCSFRRILILLYRNKGKCYVNVYVYTFAIYDICTLYVQVCTDILNVLVYTACTYFRLQKMEKMNVVEKLHCHLMSFPPLWYVQTYIQSIPSRTDKYI